MDLRRHMQMDKAQATEENTFTTSLLQQIKQKQIETPIWQHIHNI